MRILYFAHDLNDTAIARRVRMLHMGGAEVKLIGFHRGLIPAPEIEGVVPVVLGRTYDDRLRQRAIQVVRRTLDAGRWRKLIRWADVLLARNLEMSVIANAARNWVRTSTPLIYECLDIHRLSAAQGLVPNALREIERFILRRSKALIVSSPSFLDQFFSTLGITLPEVILAENKRVFPQCGERPKALLTPRMAPWRIGWFANLRCTTSFDEMVEMATRHPSLVEFVLRGRPTDEIQARIDQHLPLANMRFEGPYSQPDLGSMYRDCAFTWGIERYAKRAATADWVLGNRLYEGGFYNVPTIALAGTASADWLKSRNTGVLVNSCADFETWLVTLTSQHYAALQASAAAIPTSDLIWTPDDCRAFTRRLNG